jgi:hypothetical protein
MRGGVLLLAVALASAAFLRADDSADIHQVVANVATALSSGDPAMAISSFSKSYTDHDKLSDDFEALTGAYSLNNQVEFTDEDVSASAATVTVHWALTLSTRQTGFTANRNADITLKVAREGKHWRIVAFGPIGIFDPQVQ